MKNPQNYHAVGTDPKSLKTTTLSEQIQKASKLPRCRNRSKNPQNYHAVGTDLKTLKTTTLSEQI